jgi:hypothetical protein
MAESFKHKGQGYRRVDVVPYTRKDGSTSALQVWRSRCADCGEPFEILSTVRKRKLWYPNRRCKKHQQPGLAVKA